MAAPVLPALERISTPVRPQSPDPQRFPVVATIAPIVMSVAIYVITGSPFALLFAGLGPMMAIGSLVDGRFVRRRRAKSELARFNAEFAAATEEISEAHARERLGHEVASPSAITLATSRGREAVRWGNADPVDPVVRLGTGNVASLVTLEGAGGQRGDDTIEVRLRQLRGQAGTVSEAPVAVGAGAGIGIVGPSVIAGALARAVLLQLAAVLSPARWTVVAEQGSWLQDGPHRVRNGAPGLVLFCPDEPVLHGSGEITVAVAASADDLPSRLGTVVEVRGTGARVLRAAGLMPGTLVPALLSEELATAWAAAAVELAVADGLVVMSGVIPDTVAFADLPFSPASSAGRPAQSAGIHASLECPIGIGPAGIATLDIVAEGPHAIVGGTTGSGKSELLVSWLLSMARENPPGSLGFLLFDFKGGSSFGELVSLPHTVGLLTDLDAAGAARAMASLGAELRHRERVLAGAGVRSIGELPTSTDLGRLVVVVDEFAALASDFPALNAQFGDIAARGRSLGIHLILSTQRPVGVIRDAILANTALRISLRVNNRPDSTAVIGTDDAATTGTPPGRAWISRDAGRPVSVQVARSLTVDVAAVVSDWTGHVAPRRPWLDPLPAQLDPARLPAGAFGLLDRPAEQRQEPVRWNPAEHGNVLVIGAGRTGKSTALAAIAPAALVIPADVEGAWDALVRLAADSSAQQVVIDDLDALLTSFGQDYERSVIEIVAVLLRGTGPARHSLVIAAQRLSAPLQQLAALCDSRLLLRTSSRQDHLLAGGGAETYLGDLGPGSGHWRGVRVQVAAVPPRPASDPPLTPALAPTGLVIVASPRPTAFTERCLAAGLRCVELGSPAEGSALRYADEAGPLLLAASVEGWQAHWNSLSALRAQFPLLVEGGSLAEFRTISRLRQLPSPLADESLTGWLVQPGGTVSRVMLP